MTATTRGENGAGAEAEQAGAEAEQAGAEAEQAGAASSAVRTVVIPVAGDQSAFLPATKAFPRELMPVIETPLVQFAVDEARAAGIERFVFVMRGAGDAFGRYFVDDPAYGRVFSDLSEAARSRLAASGLPAQSMVFARQDGGPGLGRAIIAAEPFLQADEPFAVILPDDLILGPSPALKQMTARYPAVGGAMIAGIEVAPSEVSRYGIMRIEDDGGDVVRVTGLSEKPDEREERSNFSISGRYILPPEIFRALATAEVDADGRLQLTDAIALLIGGLAVNGMRFEGDRFDCGAPVGVLKAALHLALNRPEFRADMLSHMRRSLDRAEREAERAARRANVFKSTKGWRT